MLTRLQVDTEIVSEAGEALAAAGRSTAVDGSNVDLSFLEAKTLGYLGVKAVNRSDVTDADLALLGDSLEERYLDMLLIVVLDRCRRAVLMQPQKQSWKNRSVDWGYAQQEVAKMLADAKEDFRARWLHQGTPKAGRMRRLNTHVLRTGDFWPHRRPGGSSWDARFAADFDL